MFFQIEDLLVLFLCYLIGSVPFGLVFSKLFGKTDPRISGSKNIGATNVLRIHGKLLGIITLIFDILKAFLPLLLVENYNNQILIPCALTIFLGHVFPVWLKFKGGKGIAVLIGILIIYSAFYAVTFLLCWLITFILFRYSSLAAIVSSILIVCLAIVFSEPYEKYSILFLSFVVFLKHRENIFRLIDGKEEKIFF